MGCILKLYLNEELSKIMATEEAPKNTVTPAPAAAPAAVATEPKGPRSYLVVMLLAVLMLPTGLARAYRGEQIGWTRFWIYVGATVASIIPFLNILAFIAIAALAIWGVIDVFKLYKDRTDADGGALVTTPRDEKFAKGFYIYFLVCLILTGVAILVAIIFGAFIMSSLMNYTNQNTPSNYNDFNSSEYLREFENFER